MLNDNVEYPEYSKDQEVFDLQQIIKTLEEFKNGKDQLLETYKSRLNSLNEMIQKICKKESSPKLIRLETKASCYRTIIHELKNIAP